MRIMGMNKSEVLEKYPMLIQYKKDPDFTKKAYLFLIDKITEGLNLKECETLAKEKLDFALVSAISMIEDFKKGFLSANNRLDNSIKTIEYGLAELKKFFYTPPLSYRVSKSPMLIRKREEVSRVIWLATDFYVYPHTWVKLVNEVINEKEVYINFFYTENKVKHSFRISLREYKLYKEQNINLKIITKNQETEIINIVNTYFCCFKISSVFALEKIGDRLFIYPNRTRKEKVEMNLFEFEDYQKLLGD